MTFSVPGILKQISFYLICLIILGFAIKGKPGVSVSGLAFQNDNDTSTAGPFESSNSSSRFALTEAMANNHRFTLDLTQARLAAPDLVYYHNQFQTIFTPGISLVAIPFFWLGNSLHLPQLGAYFSTIVFALLNTFLVYVLARRLNANHASALLAAFTFLFATNAFAYALTLTQHHGSITVLLLALLLSLQPLSWKNCLGFGILCGVGLLFDYPNLFLLFPVGVYLLGQAIMLTVQTQKLRLQFYPQIIAIAFGLLPLVALYGWYNLQVGGSATAIGQFIGRTNYFDTQERKALDQIAATEKAKDPYSPRLPFQTRVQMQGFYILGISNERSWLFYSPVILIGILGLISLLSNHKTKNFGALLLSILVVNFVVYSMFGDPWGGWSFGPRYLLPSAAILASLIAVALTHYRSWLVKSTFVLLLGYSLVINTVAALTTASIPPKQEAIALSQPIPYTFAYNFNLLTQQKLGSLVFNVIGHNYVSGVGYYLIVLAIVMSCALFLFIKYLRTSAAIHHVK